MATMLLAKWLANLPATMQMLNGLSILPIAKPSGISFKSPLIFIPEAQGLSVPRRNPTVADREILAID